jgi:peptidoglycan/xylan/chitin deacetylase (PgdA/CDA1 family)
MYHHLKYREPDASAVLKTWSVAPDQFAAQLDYYLERGFHTITFKQLVEFYDGKAPLPTKPILLTFDDGWIDSYTVAFPELKKRGMVGNFFVPTRYADAGGELLMNWEQILEMDRAGMEFGGHTINHEDLTKVNVDVMQWELSGAKKLMEDKLGHPTYALSYPFGAFNPKVMSATEAAGYRAGLILCCGYEQGADILFALPRIRISYDETLQEIGGKLP